LAGDSFPDKETAVAVQNIMMPKVADHNGILVIDYNGIRYLVDAEGRIQDAATKAFLAQLLGVCLVMRYHFDPSPSEGLDTWTLETAVMELFKSTSIEVLYTLLFPARDRSGRSSKITERVPQGWLSLGLPHQ
jgi:hypothetical protein